MFNKKHIALLSLCVTLLMTGCGYDRIVVDDPLSEAEIIKFAQEKVKDETGDDVTVEIVSKKQMQIATMWLDGPMNYQNVEGGHEYELKITSAKDKSIVTNGYYKDGYIIYDEKYHPSGDKNEACFDSNYVSDKAFNQVKNEFIDALELRFDEYYIYEDVSATSGLDIFICSTDYDLINDLLISFKYSAKSFRDEEYVEYSVYIFNDKEVFDGTDFDLYKDCTQDHGGQSYGPDIISQITGKQAVKLAYCDSFDRVFFESGGVSGAKVLEDTSPDTYDYIVFWYKAEPNSFVGANSPDLYSLGVLEKNT